MIGIPRALACLAVLLLALAMPGNAEAHEAVSGPDSSLQAELDSGHSGDEIRVNAPSCPTDQPTSCCTMGCCVAVSPYVAPARAPGAMIMGPPGRIATIRSRIVLPPLKPPKPAA